MKFRVFLFGLKKKKSVLTISFFGFTGWTSQETIPAQFWPNIVPENQDHSYNGQSGST